MSLQKTYLFERCLSVFSEVFECVLRCLSVFEVVGKENRERDLPDCRVETATDFQSFP